MADSIYGKEYAETWIKHHESGDDSFRKEHLQPYLAKAVSESGSDSVLDVGCGWGQVLDYVKSGTKYHGVDLVEEFFPYILEKYKDRLDDIKLETGFLPDGLNVGDGPFGMVVCSMVLHTVKDLAQSIKTLYSKIDDKGRIVIITFNNDSRDYIKSCFTRIDELTDSKINGEFVLPSKNTIECEVYFHAEDKYEAEIKKHGSFSKKVLGPLFVAYECKR